MINLALALVLAAFAVGIIAVIVKLVLDATNLQPAERWERFRLERYLTTALEGDRALDQGNLEGALGSYATALYPNLANTRSVAEAVINHHTALLSRFIAAADELQGGTVRLLSLAKADRLMTERRALQRRWLTIRQQKQREQLPTIREEYRTNTDELQTALAQLATEILNSRKRVQYH